MKIVMMAALASFFTIMALRSVGPVVLLVVWALSAVYIFAFALARAAGCTLPPPSRDRNLDYDLREAETSARRDLADPAWWKREGFPFTAAVLAADRRAAEQPVHPADVAALQIAATRAARLEVQRDAQERVASGNWSVNLIDGTWYCSTDVIPGLDGEPIAVPAHGCGSCFEAALRNARARLAHRVLSRSTEQNPSSPAAEVASAVVGHRWNRTLRACECGWTDSHSAHVEQARREAASTLDVDG